MDVYLPIANLSVNGLVIVALGALTGILSGMFGVGGGFLTTPLMIFYGIPPTVAAASAASQVTGASVSGVLAHRRRGGVDYRMGGVMVAGGIIGTGIGALLFRLLQQLGQIDTVINLLYVTLLGTIGNGLFTALQAEQYREAALITFLVAVSGVTIAGIGSAFWGVVAGSLALFVQHYGKR